MDASSFDARRALLHPVWLASLALLVLNDHFLKGAGLLPQIVTGKLSDVVGMLVAPAALAALLYVVGVRSRRSWTLSHVAVGVVFAAINVSSVAARAFESLTALTPLPWVIAVDPTDLVVLPLLAVSFVVLGRASQATDAASLPRRFASERVMPRVMQGAALTAGTLACMGTSAPPCDQEECRAPEPVPREQAALTLGNTTDQQRLVRVRPMSADVAVDCEVLLADPTATTHRLMFEPAEAWLLEPGRALPLLPRHSQGCEAFLVDAQGLPMTLIAFSNDAFPTVNVPTAVANANELPGRMVMMRQAGSELELDVNHPAVFDAPLEEPYDPEPSCAVPDATVGIAWSELPVGPQTVLSLSSSPDGCHDVELENESFYVCLPLAALPFEVDDVVRVSPHSIQGALDNLPTAARGIRIASDRYEILAVAGTAVLPPVADSEFDVSVDTQTGCAPHHDDCGNYVTPLEVTYLGNGLESLRAGESAQRTEGGSTLYMVRAQHMPIRNGECTDIDVSLGDYYFETVLVTPIDNEQP